MRRAALRNGLTALLALLLAAFFGFVGWNKAFAALADLARYHAWTIYLPETLGRLVGWSEMVLAAGLLFALAPKQQRLGQISALVLVVNQFVAALIHLAHGESGALPQNAVLIAMLLGLFGLTRTRGSLPDA